VNDVGTFLIVKFLLLSLMVCIDTLYRSILSFSQSNTCLKKFVHGQKIFSPKMAFLHHPVVFCYTF
jgi:hypothetical protein